MQTFKEYLQKNDPEVLDEILRDLANSKFVRNAVLAGGLAAGSLGFGSKDAHAADNRPVASQSVQDKDVIEKDGFVYIRGTVKVKDESPQSRLQAAKVAETKILAKAAKYFESKGGKPGVVPPRYK
jgi:hypothetical protein